jgi:hypothetical protein
MKLASGARIGAVLVCVLNAGCGGKSSSEERQGGTSHGNGMAGAMSDGSASDDIDPSVDAGVDIDSVDNVDVPTSIEVDGGPGKSCVDSDASAPVDPTAAVECPTSFPGVDYRGLVGSVTCPPAGSAAFLVYGQTIHQACTRVSGGCSIPLDVGYRCEYTFDETACGNDYIGTGGFQLPFFGPGGPRAPLPAKVITDLDALCTTSQMEQVVAVDDAADQANLTIGFWLSCLGAQPYYGEGIAFFADGSMQDIRLNADGRLELVDDCGALGLWGYLPDTPAQLNLSRAVGYNYVHPTFSQGTERHMSFGTMAGFGVDLVRIEDE